MVRTDLLSVLGIQFHFKDCMMTWKDSSAPMKTVDASQDQFESLCHVEELFESEHVMELLKRQDV